MTDRLRQVAGQATPGPWELDLGRWLVTDHPSMHRRTLEHVDGSGWQHDGDLEYVSTFDPVLVSALLEVIDAAEKLTDEMRELVYDDPPTEWAWDKLDERLARFRDLAHDVAAVAPAAKS